MRHIVNFPMDARLPCVRLPLLCIPNVVTYTHHQNAMLVTLLTGDPLMLVPITQCHALFWALIVRVSIVVTLQLLLIGCRTLPYMLNLRSRLLLQYSLPLAEIASCCISIAIIVFYRSEIYSPTFILSTTSATTLVSVRNTRVFRTALTALTEPRTL